MNTKPLPNVTAVSIEGRGLLFEGAPGSGKSTLALALIDRGAQLIGDDGVTLEQRDDRVWAAPPPNIAGKIEIRNIGIIELPATEAPLALVLSLTDGAPRYIDQAESRVLFGTEVPLGHFDPAIAAAPIRAEWALKIYGLSG